MRNGEVKDLEKRSLRIKKRYSINVFTHTANNAAGTIVCFTSSFYRYSERWNNKRFSFRLGLFSMRAIIYNYALFKCIVTFLIVADYITVF